MVKKFEAILALFWLIILVVWIILPWLPQFRSISLPQFLLFWWVFIGWIFLTYLFKLKSKFTFIVALSLFAISALFTTIGLQSFAETIMRFSLIGWVIGFLQALIEYKKGLPFPDEKGKQNL